MGWWLVALIVWGLLFGIFGVIRWLGGPRRPGETPTPGQKPNETETEIRSRHW
jgi:hypothetical protein